MSIRMLALRIAVIVATALGVATAHAQSNIRTWVSGAGNDVDNTACSRGSPCLTFGHALAETASGGEIDCLDPGDFGPVTIGISVTINCEGAANGRINVGGNSSAILIDAANIAVNLIGLDINGENASTAAGVTISVPAVVSIRNCKIYGFTGDTGVGIYFQPSASGGDLVVDNVFVVNNSAGIVQESGGGAANMTVRNSNVSNNSLGIFSYIFGGTHAGLTVEQTTLAFNKIYGLLVESSGSVAILGTSTVVNNGSGVSAQSGGIIYSFKNNQVGGNGSDGIPLTAYPGYSGGGA
jgi:hypothetical protein